MNSALKNFLLSAVLIAVPAGGFALVETTLAPPPTPTAAASAAAQGLGDLSAYSAIVADAQKIAQTDLAAAERRITDLETLWDKNAAALRKADAGAWGAVDGAADAAFSALRARAPDRATVNQTLAALQATLAAPTPAAAGGPVQAVAGIAVTDASGRPLPCEELIGQLRARLAGKTAPSEVAALQTKALERCNADDDAHSNAFAAQALSKLKD